MQASHIHLGVKDLGAALDWLEQYWDVKPSFRVPTMACVTFGGVMLMLDASETDTRATVAFKSENCDADFEKVASRGAKVVKAPQDYPWKVRAGYFEGPGALTFEIEQPL